MTELQNVTKLNDLIGVDKYISHMNKWYNNLNKIFILSLEGNTGIGKSILAELFLIDKGYNITYFDISIIKTKTNMFQKIKQSFKSYDICSMLNNSKKKTAYILDNIESNVLSKTEINELHNLFIKNDTIRPVILIGNYNKTTNYPKKKIDTLKMYAPTDTILFNIAKKYINDRNYNVNNINLKLITNKCQNDIKKLIILIEQFKSYKVIKKDTIIIKDCNYNLFTDFSNLLASYKPIDTTNIFSDQVILLTYTFHQNIFNFTINNCKKDLETHLFNWNKYLLESLDYEQQITKNHNWDFLNYLYYIGSKKISYEYNKVKKNKNITQQVDYPKYCYLTNQKNIYKKLMQLFKKYDFYEQLTEDNFKLFIQNLFNNKSKYQYIFDNLKKDEIETLSKIV
tara:strand:+ start:798 stop:1991 length:1194 start_codon:yes stop_codon:yes gene_type:complete